MPDEPLIRWFPGVSRWCFLPVFSCLVKAAVSVGNPLRGDIIASLAFEKADLSRPGHCPAEGGNDRGLAAFLLWGVTSFWVLLE